MLKLIGKFGVDSCQAMVGDPCYLDSWNTWDNKSQDFDDHPKHKGEYSYLGACNATITDGYGELGQGSAVVFNTGFGDGVYPVYAQINGGIIEKIVIDFNATLDDKDSDE